MNDQGMKFDHGKRRWSLLPLSWLRPLLSVLTFGATKYKPFSFLDQVDNPKERYGNSLMRHVEDWQSGVRVDAESGLLTLAHIQANAMILIALDDPTVIPAHLRSTAAHDE